MASNRRNILNLRVTAVAGFEGRKHKYLDVSQLETLMAHTTFWLIVNVHRMWV